MIHLIMISAIALAIGIGYRTKINIGLLAIAFSYLIATTLMGLSPKELLHFWPTSLFFTIFSVSLFYNVATTNGTLDVLAQHILYRTRTHPNALYMILYLMATLLSALGALIGAQAVNWGASGGANLITSSSGIVFQGLFKQMGWEEQAFSLGNHIFIVSIIYPLIVLLLLSCYSHYSKGRTNSSLTIDQPPLLSKVQRQTTLLMISSMVLVWLFPLLHLIFPNIAWIATYRKTFDIGFVSILMVCLALRLKLGKQEAILAKVPWATIIMLCGMSLLMSLAVKSGLVTLIGHLMTTSIPHFWLPLFFCVIAGVMSLFSSTLSVVAPALFPIIAIISAQNPQIDIHLLTTATVIGALSTNISPFSSAGSLIQLSLPNIEERGLAFKKQIILGVPISLSLGLLTTWILILLASLS
ncbi:Malonate permease [Streptococcus pneumoniae]|uniref:SLC13 family permease n=1 Tax=Streptococcus pneumoniae TaxID=1313 RepID=UPI00062CDC98|nr:SLC13 family permease [Streptococcus pneumoniae]CRI62522.1 Malonate permease [Streptococcus pneumoniae]